MPFKTSYNSGLGQPSINLAGVTLASENKIVAGTILKGFDDLLGEGEFIYLPGAANVAAGDCVLYDLNPAGATVTRHTNATGSNSGRPVAFAVSAVPAGSFGWYQIAGCAIVNTVAGTAAGVMMGTATAGAVGNTADAGDQILGARISTAVGTPAAGQSYATLNRPYVQGQIT